MENFQLRKTYQSQKGDENRHEQTTASDLEPSAVLHRMIHSQKKKKIERDKG